MPVELVEKKLDGALPVHLVARDGLEAAGLAPSTMAWARARVLESPYSGPISCTPTGSPEVAGPAGMAVAGRCRAVASEIQFSIAA